MVKRSVQGVVMQWLMLLIFGVTTAAQVAAATSAPTPHEVVDSVTRQLMQVVADKSQYLDTQPEVYFQAVGELLDPVVDFEFIARAVMGSHAAQATPAQRREFARVFRQGLIGTYSKGIAGFGNLQMKVLQPETDVASQKRVSVLQEVQGPDKVSRVYYTMARNRDGHWKLINMVLNGVNLGETLRNQFSSSMQRVGNLDQVIAQWAVDAGATAPQG